MGEIDLIMVDDTSLVFIEVRFRSDPNYGDPLESITRSKQRKVIKAASHYLLTEVKSHNIPCRFDAVGVTNDELGQLTFNWVKQAFY